MEEKVELTLGTYNKLYDTAVEYKNAKHVVEYIYKYGEVATIYTESKLIKKLGEELSLLQKELKELETTDVEKELRTKITMLEAEVRRNDLKLLEALKSPRREKKKIIKELEKSI